MKAIKKNKNEKQIQKAEAKLTFSPKLMLGKTKIRADITHTLWLEANSQIYTFAQGSNTYYLNLIQELVANTTVMDKYKVSTPQNDTTYVFEYIKVKSISIKFVPIGVNKIITPALPGFSLRVLPSEPSLRYLPNGVQGKYIPANDDILINNTDKQIEKSYEFRNTVFTDRRDLYKYYSGYDFYNQGYYGNLSGILLINQTTPADVSDVRYKLGHIEMTFQVEGINLVG